MKLAALMLAEQHGIDPDSVVAIDFHALRAGYDPSTAPPTKFR